ncbi:MAG: hypothetical protein EA383_02395 [Spirochaetaceae bacterium]|nr:MAG: hypothetical protein EA383_02395 [Spirochaetaceae bacterium]
MAQTIMPDLENLDSLAARRLVEFTNVAPGDYTRDPVDFWVPGTPINDIPFGTWDITLTLFDGADQLIAQGVAEGVLIDAASVPVSIDIFPFLTGTGTLQFTITFPPAFVDTAEIELAPFDMSPEFFLSAPDDFNVDFATTGTLTIDTTVAAGGYALVIRLFDTTAQNGDGAHAPIVKAVHVYDSLVSTAPPLDLTVAELRSPPAAPSGLNVVQIDLEPTVQLSWIDEANTEEGYRVYRNGTLISGDLGPNVTMYTDTSGAGGVEYTYEVRAFNSFGESVSGAATRTVTLISDVGLEAPLNLAENVALRTNFEWDPGSGSDTLELFIFEDGNLVFSEVGIPGTQEGFILDEANQLNRQTDYTWYVVARNTDFEVQTPELSFTTADNIIRVAPNGGGDGSGWGANAADFQWAVDESINIGPVEIWVQAGTYEPVGRPNGGDAGDPRTRHFALRPNVEVYGGFDGTETERSQRDPVANETIFSGGPVNVTGAGATLQLGGNENNVYHVFYHPTGTNLTRDTILDGVVIEGGNANVGGGTDPTYRGGGMYLVDASPTLQNVTFRYNLAGQGGALGIFGDSVPSVTESLFDRNIGVTRGGAVHISTPALQPIVFAQSEFTGNLISATTGRGAALNFENFSVVHTTKNHFENNHSNGGGGAITVGTNANGIIANSSFTLNEAGDRGGAIYTVGLAVTLQVYNSVFHQNTAQSGGAIGMFRSGQNVQITNVTINQNSATISGGAIWIESGPPRIYNSILWSNTANEGTAIYMAESPTYDADPRNIDVSNTTIQDFGLANTIVFFSGDDVGTYTDVDALDPLFVGPANPVGVDGIWRTADDGLQLALNSPAIDAGNTTLLPQDIADIDNDGITAEQIPIDILGNTRVIGAQVDRGAYEFQ